MIEKTYNVGIYCRLSNDDERDGSPYPLKIRSSCCKAMCVSRAGTRDRGVL